MSGHTALVAASPREPDLSGLDAEQASSLEQIAGEALISFGLRRAELRGRCRQVAPQGRYAADTAGQIDHVRRLETMARRFLASAHARSRAAERERCLAVRAVQAFAAAVLAPAPAFVSDWPAQRRSVRLPTSTDSSRKCATEPSTLSTLPLPAAIEGPPECAREP